MWAGKGLVCRSVLLTLAIGSTDLAQAQVDEIENVDGSVVLPELLDAERAFQVAKSAAAAGDYQTAIVALERVLLINPDLSNIKFELALLYRNVGATNRATYYLQESLKDSAMPDTVRARAESELAALAGTSVVSRGDFYGSLGVRTQYETNARQESDKKQLNQGQAAGGISISPTNSATLGSDVSLIASAGVGYRYRFGETGANTWNTALNASLSRYDHFSTEDSSSLSLRSGVTFRVGSENNADVKQTLTPFIQFSKTFDDSDYKLQGDAASDEIEEPVFLLGVSYQRATGTHSANLTVQAALEDEDRLSTIRGGSSWRMGDQSTGIGSLSVSLNDADNEISSYHSIGGSLALERRIGATRYQRPISARVGVAGSIREYDGINALLDPAKAREDKQISLFSTMEYPLGRKAAFNAGVQWVENQSSIVNYEFSNVQISAGVSWRFD